MSNIGLTSKYLFNEIPGDQKKIDEFGYKACKLSLAKKWQFSLPDTVFLSGDLVKEIFEKKTFQLKSSHILIINYWRSGLVQ